MNYKDLMSAVKLMGQGMTGVFIVMTVIFILVYFLAKFSAKKKEE